MSLKANISFVENVRASVNKVYSKRQHKCIQLLRSFEAHKMMVFTESVTSRYIYISSASGKFEMGHDIPGM